MATKVTEEMVDHLDEEADALGVTRAEYIRRVLDLYLEATDEGVTCTCGNSLRLRV